MAYQFIRRERLNRFRVSKKNPSSQAIALRATLRDERIRFGQLLKTKAGNESYAKWKSETDAAIAEINRRIRATNA